MYNIEDAIAALQREIEETNQRIRVLQEAQEHGIGRLTEDTYHEMCLTHLRSSDLLGIALTEVFPFLTYEKGGINYYYFKTENGLTVQIPNSAVRDVEIVVDRYFPDAEKSMRAINSNHAFRKGECQRIITSCEEYLTSCSLVKRAKIAYRRYRTWFAVLSYCFHFYKWGRFRKEAQNSLEQAKRKEREIANKITKEITDAKENRIRQQTELMRLAAEFLRWTKRVYIYQKGSAFQTEEFYMENDKVTFKESR